MDFKDLTPELQEQARSCKTPEEILALAKDSDYDLSDEELTAVTGGDGDWTEAIVNCDTMDLGK